MNFTCDLLIERIIQALSSQYRVCPAQGDPLLRAVCDSHRSVERRLGQRIKLLTFDTDRLLYLVHVPELDFQSLADCRQLALEDGIPKLPLTDGHICAGEIGLLILCDRAQPDAIDALIRSKLPASHRRRLPNRLHFPIAAVDLSTGETAFNRSGRAMKKLIASGDSQA